MMNKKEELLKVIQENPEHNLVFMYSGEVHSDSVYVSGEITKIEVTKTTTHNDVIYTESQEAIIAEAIEEDIYENKYGSGELTEEEEVELEKSVQEQMEKLKWNPAIVVYID